MIKFESKQKIMPVNTNQTIIEFKKELKSFVGLSPTRFRLFYYDQENPDDCELEVNWEEITSSKRCLHSYKIKDGDEFHIIPK